MWFYGACGTHLSLPVGCRCKPARRQARSSVRVGWIFGLFRPCGKTGLRSRLEALRGHFGLGGISIFSSAKLRFAIFWGSENLKKQQKINFFSLKKLKFDISHSFTLLFQYIATKKTPSRSCEWAAPGGGGLFISPGCQRNLPVPGPGRSWWLWRSHT